MRATAWNSGNTYGIRVGSPNRDQFFDRSWYEIEVEIEGQWHHFALTAGFWNHCPEFRSPIIREWFARYQLLKWSHGNPPTFELRPLGGNRFRLARE
jgi:hypothetical protein